MSDSWIQTWSGAAFEPLNPRPEDVRIEDIAHALSNICRFNGHCDRFYSVAEHSLYVMHVTISRFTRVVPRVGGDHGAAIRDMVLFDIGAVTNIGLSTRLAKLAIEALIHDASEAYLCDLPRPLKSHPSLKAIYLEAEGKVEAAIRDALQLPILEDDHRAVIREADDRMLTTEKRDLMAVQPKSWGKLPEPYDFLFIPTSFQGSNLFFMHLWMSAYRALTELLQLPFVAQEGKKWDLLF